MKKIKVAIIGSGPAGYTAGIYAARAKLKPTIFAGEEIGGQLMFTTEVENFPGFPKAIRGPVLMDRMREQAEHFGAELEPHFITAVDFSHQPFRLWTQLPSSVSAPELIRLKQTDYSVLAKQIKQQPADYLVDSVIIATGAVPIRLHVPGEDKFMGRGVSVCAVCDAAFFKDKNVYVIGGGDSAMEDTLALTKFARQVNVVHRRANFRASKIMCERVLHHPKVKIFWNSQLTEIMGETVVNKIRIVTKDEKTDQLKERVLDADGVFLAIGHRPVSGIFTNEIQIDDHGYILTRKSLSAAGLQLGLTAVDKGVIAYPSMTTSAGVFAAGDVVDVRYKQAITAAAQGCEAALDVERWLENNQS